MNKALYQKIGERIKFWSNPWYDLPEEIQFWDDELTSKDGTPFFEDVFDQNGRMSQEHEEQLNKRFISGTPVQKIKEAGFFVKKYTNYHFGVGISEGSKLVNYYPTSGKWVETTGKNQQQTHLGGVDSFIQFLAR